MSLQNILTTSSRATVASAETHRLSAISNIENALARRHFTEQPYKRLLRLLKILRDAEQETAARKLEILQTTVIPAPETLGLVEE